jgi:dTDP-4-amino-4,6-dideoxygalactose transaminase
MATSKPRLQVLVTEEVLAIYTDAAAVFGVSASKLAAQCLMEASGAIQQMAVVMAEAKAHQSDAAVRAAQGLKGVLVDVRQDAAEVQMHLEDAIASHKRSEASQVQPKPKAKAKAKPKPKA